MKKQEQFWREVCLAAIRTPGLAFDPLVAENQNHAERAIALADRCRKAYVERFPATEAVIHVRPDESDEFAAFVLDVTGLSTAQREYLVAVLNTERPARPESKPEEEDDHDLIDQFG